MPITIRKTNELTYTPGGADQLLPASPSAAKRYKDGDYDPVIFEPIVDIRVSIATVVRETAKFLECEVMGDNIASPDTICMFWVYIQYRWPRKDGVTDYDEVLTDGNKFYLTNRHLGDTPFRLNDYTRDKILATITKFTENF